MFNKVKKCDHKEMKVAWAAEEVIVMILLMTYEINEIGIYIIGVIIMTVTVQHRVEMIAQTIYIIRIYIVIWTR